MIFLSNPKNWLEIEDYLSFKSHIFFLSFFLNIKWSQTHIFVSLIESEISGCLVHNKCLVSAF